MLCKRPFRQGLAEYGCGQCIPCRLNRRRTWTARLLLEQRSHSVSSFVTLTYSDEFLPFGGTLSPRDLQLFLKRLRKRLAPEKVRYFACGEYGDVTNRPHYHLALFGCADAVVIGDAWECGGVHVGELNEQSAAYVVSYTVKRMTAKEDERLGGRHPEFARMSLRPGIGAHAVPSLCDSLVTESGSVGLLALGDVPTVLKEGGKNYPIGS